MSAQRKKNKERGLGSYFSCTRRKFLKMVGGLAVSSSAAGMGLITPQSLMASILAPREVTIGIFGPSHCAAPFVFTKQKGFFDEEKLNVNIINYQEMPLIAKDLISGKLDFGQMVVPLAFAMHTGAKPFAANTPVVITQIAGTNGAALMVRKNSHIKNPSDFKGKTMANHSKLSVHYLINMMFLEANGLRPTADIKFKVIELDEIAGAMNDGKIDTFVMPEPKDAMVEAKGIGDVYLLSKYIWPNHPCCALVTRKKFFDDNKELVASVTRMTTKGGLLANEAGNREDLVTMLRKTSDYKYQEVPEAILMKAFTPGRSDFYPFPFQSSARVIIEIMKKYKLLPHEINDRKLAREVFLSDLSRKLIKELGAQPPESDYRQEKILGSLKTYSD